ncbi:hypothetical protein HMPREF9103_00777 [Lentilactobacillus parafarraginis F0439]|uniref:NADPH-dependent FMN reductase n=1 Tax=Lentilactobacillus parafarraginis F0439 TaxID=797515 RepID=G9ZM29_9LACO|nr:PAS domain-containing protein [Lentilactobacillus parafarraginis]EHM00005.1 hypothetical protein HMPREF9103_00777 [Lentilactobacillus parafarraginis F0439]
MSKQKPFIKSPVVQFKTGTLSLDQIEAIFDVLPFEIDFLDVSDRFTWYSDKPNREYPRHVSDLQKTIQQLHPGPAGMFAQKVIDSFKAGKQEHFEQPLKLNGQMVYINYYALRDQDGNYLGTIGYTGTVDHIADLIKHGAWDQDVTTGASMHQSAKSPTKTVPNVAVMGSPKANNKDSSKPDITTSASHTGMKDDR